MGVEAGGAAGAATVHSVQTLGLPPPVGLIWREAGATTDGVNHATGEYYGPIGPFADLTDDELAARGLARVNLNGPADSGAWYHEALQLPPVRIRGWFGTTLGSDEADTDVQLFVYDRDHLQPTMKLVVDRNDLLAIFAGLGKLLHERLGLLKQWDLRPLPADGADGT